MLMAKYCFCPKRATKPPCQTDERTGHSKKVNRMLEHANCGLSKFRRLDLMVNSFLALVSSRRKKGSWDTEYELRQMWSSITLGVKIIQTTGKL
ncbi:hypothetical protein F2P81_013755 [Scophthalmus maximus]|uniref:Uncharacterized protein n=1 Tax=Scophthalmus maximus TaxID=52904 RepID=A0A6A4SM53_SCOMX|nr:hypothetical protein F2P81_013755 [Scophthalmus maximus]